jgi:hypothetical protein
MAVERSVEKRDLQEEPQGRAWFLGALAWAIPGAGHLAQGRLWRGVLLGGSVWAMFIAGILFGGHLHNLFSRELGALSQVFGLFNLGIGLMYLIGLLTGTGFAQLSELGNYAREATYEYGNTFLMIAGLLNYLVMLDAFDLAVGRKR